MTILKKTLYAGLAAITLASVGTVATTTTADAGYRYSHNHHNNYSCYYKQVWRTNHHGYGHWVTIKVCN